METTLTATPGSEGHLEEVIDMIRDIILVIIHNSMSSIGVDIIDQIPIYHISIHVNTFLSVFSAAVHENHKFMMNPRQLNLISPPLGLSRSHRRRSICHGNTRISHSLRSLLM